MLKFTLAGDSPSIVKITCVFRLALKKHFNYFLYHCVALFVDGCKNYLRNTMRETDSLQ